MQDDGYIPPMNPDDLAALAAFAGPMFQQSRQIEAFCSESPIPGGNREFGSISIKRGLEQAHQLTRDSVIRQMPQYVPPADPQFLQSVSYVEPVPTHYVEPTVTPIQHVHVPQVNFAPPTNGAQLELNFSKSEQAITNDLLREISKKITVLINLIDKPESEDRLPKLNPKKHNVSPQNNKPTPI
jgi:hypothetical protein